MWFNNQCTPPPHHPRKKYSKDNLVSYNYYGVSPANLQKGIFHEMGNIICHHCLCSKSLDDSFCKLQFKVVQHTYSVLLSYIINQLKHINSYYVAIFDKLDETNCHTYGCVIIVLCKT